MQYDLVFEGGGAKGIVFAGAIEEFFSRGNEFGRLLGTSAGAITATLLAAGYSPTEMEAALNEKDAGGVPVFAQFLGAPPPLSDAEIDASDIRSILRGVNSRVIPDFLEEKIDDVLADFLASRSYMRNLFAFVQRGGWYSAHAFIDWLTDKLDSGMYNGARRGFSAMTLAQFYAATGVDLSLVAADTGGEQMLVLNHRTAPDCPVVSAVRMSMSIPLLWDEVIWQTAWGQYRKQDIAGNTIVDGGLLSSFPIELFVSSAPFVTRVMGPKSSTKVLGCLIDESRDVPKATSIDGGGDGGLLSNIGKLDTVGRLKSLVNTMTMARDKDVIDTFRHLVVYCPAKGYGTMEFDMSDARREALVAAGKAAMQTYLDNPPAPMIQASPFESASQESVIANRVARGILGDG